MPDYKKDILTLLYKNRYKWIDLRPLLNSYIVGLQDSEADLIRSEMKGFCHQLQEKKFINKGVSPDSSFTAKMGGRYQTGPSLAQLTMDGEEAYQNAYGKLNQNMKADDRLEMTQESERAYCPSCNKDQKASLCTEYTKSWKDPDHPLDGRDEYRVLRCNGCDTIFFQHQNYLSEDTQP